MAQVDILLATYNGEMFIEELIESIAMQSYPGWQIIIRDDGSTDDTITIIEKLIIKYPKRIVVLNNGGLRLGSTLSFAKLIEISTADYIMLCDQDDVWLKDKILLTLKHMQKSEMEYPDKPLMVFTDLKLVDQDLNVISDSFIKNQKLDIQTLNDPVKILALNVVTGCTILINKKVKSYVVPIKSKYIIHDQWIAANVCYYGRIIFLDTATILYRQHSNNTVGSNKVDYSYFFKKLLRPQKQIRIYIDLINGLNFRVSVLKFIYYKLLYSVKRF